MCAIGGVLRNCKGEFVRVFYYPIPPMEINKAEVLAIHHAIQISLNSERFKSHEIEIEYNSHNAVQWCSQPKRGSWHLTFILNFIKSA